MTDKSSRTLTASELIRQLQKVPPDTPVVMSQEDEPAGDYGVRAVDVVDMQRDPLYADGSFGRDVYYGYEARFPVIRWSDRYEPPRPVVFLGHLRPHMPIVDGEIAQKELS